VLRGNTVMFMYICEPLILAVFLLRVYLTVILRIILYFGIMYTFRDSDTLLLSTLVIVNLPFYSEMMQSITLLVFYICYT
jgi:hypothetical protein